MEGLKRTVSEKRDGKRYFLPTQCYDVPSGRTGKRFAENFAVELNKTHKSTLKLGYGDSLSDNYFTARPPGIQSEKHT